MFFDLNRAIRDEVVTLHLPRADRGRPERGCGRAAAVGRTAPATARSLRAPVARRRRRDPRRRRRVTATAAIGGGGAVATGQPKPVVKSELENDRPQRPVLVRLGQEVQEVPRRVSALAQPNPPLTDGRISLAPLTQADLADALAMCDDEDTKRFTFLPTDATAGVDLRLAAPLRGGLGRRIARGVLDSRRRARAPISASPRSCGSTCRTGKGRSATSSRPHARGRGAAAAAVGLLTRWGVRRARRRAARAAHRHRQSRVRAGCRARRLSPRRRPALARIQGRAPHRHRRLVTACERLGCDREHGRPPSARPGDRALRRPRDVACRAAPVGDAARGGLGRSRVPAHVPDRARLRDLEQLLVRGPLLVRHLQPDLLPARRAARHPRARARVDRNRGSCVHARRAARVGAGARASRAARSRCCGSASSARRRSRSRSRCRSRCCRSGRCRRDGAGASRVGAVLTLAASPLAFLLLAIAGVGALVSRRSLRDVGLPMPRSPVPAPSSW